MRISDWSSDVCSSDLLGHKNTGTDGHAVVAIAHYPVHMPIAQLEELLRRAIAVVGEARLAQDRILKRDGKGGVRAAHAGSEIGRASGRGRACQAVEISVVDASLNKTSRLHKCEHQLPTP